jgi:hypothetical protein
MSLTQEVDQVAPGAFIWQVYDKSVKADLFSTGLETTTGTYLIDPIPLAAGPLAELQAQRKISGIFVTNVNHIRAAIEFATLFAVPMFVNAKLYGTAGFPDATAVQDRKMFSEGLTGIALEGGPLGEMALHYDDAGGTLVIGDALINFEPHGFGLLPAKYCQNARRMRQSLKNLLEYSFERMFFAHGTPLLSGARAQVEQLIGKSR